MNNHLNSYEQRRRRCEWFIRDRFGLFIHWGLYATPARGEWVRSVERISAEAYQPYFDNFRPDRYDPREWARTAKNAGMRYAVLTAKHHDGFCLFDSKLTDYKATRTPAARDLIREYVDAFRAEGLKVGFYYSLLDWKHPDYPHHGDRHHPMRDNPACGNADRQWHRYADYLHGQVRELLTNYGKIDILWFDFSYDDMSGEKWRAKELMAMVRELQPHVITDNRLDASFHSDRPDFTFGDIYTPEQLIPPEQPIDSEGHPAVWEACITQNGNWGYHKDDNLYLSARQTVRTLVNCVSKGGNLLINAGPDARGVIPEEQQRILATVGEWLRVNGDSIYGAGPAPLPKPEWGRLTVSGNRLFCHIQEPGMGTIILPGAAKFLRNPRLLTTGQDVTPIPWFTERLPNDAVMILPRKEFELDPVIEWEIIGKI